PFVPAAQILREHIKHDRIACEFSAILHVYLGRANRQKACDPLSFSVGAHSPIPLSSAFPPVAMGVRYPIDSAAPARHSCRHHQSTLAVAGWTAARATPQTDASPRLDPHPIG